MASVIWYEIRYIKLDTLKIRSLYFEGPPRKVFRVRKRKARKLPFMTRFANPGKMTRFINLGTGSRMRPTQAPETSTERVEVIDMVGGAEEKGEEGGLSPHDISLVRY